MHRKFWFFVVVMLAVPAAAAAGSGVSGSPQTNPSFGVTIPGQGPDVLAAGSTPAQSILLPAESPASAVDGHARQGWDGYAQQGWGRPRRPRSSYRSPRSVIPVVMQIHAGFYDPFDNFSTGFNGGLRIGPQPDPHVQFGLGADWWHRSKDETLDLGRVAAPGGRASEQLVVSQSSANLVPVLAFVQVSGDENMPLIPYGGFGAGYEWLFLNARDYRTHGSFDQTFGGWGWQVWGGAGLRLDPRTRFNGEVFFNQCDVGTDVDVNLQDYGPARVRDVIDMNGVGMRFGVAWEF